MMAKSTAKQKQSETIMKVDQVKTKVGVVYDCEKRCGTGRDFMFSINEDIPEQIEGACPGCDVGNLIINLDKTFSAYQTELISAELT